MKNKKRLIDANDVYSLFEENGTARLHVGHIDAIPRVDAAPVVHGRWERRVVDWSAPYSWKVECSNCGYYICGLGDAYLFKYCPNCGAKMDGGNEDG